MSEVQDRHHVALITGGSSGLGLACSRALVSATTPAWRVIVASRDSVAGHRAVETLDQAAGRACAEYLPLDLGDLDDIRRFGAKLRGRVHRLQALVCNAGLQFTAEARTRQGLEATFGINHLGHFVLFQEISSLLSADARIVVVSSGTHDPAQRTGMPEPRWVEPALLARPELDANKSFEAFDSVGVVMRRRYTTSKLCNLYFAYELHRRIADGTAGLPVSITVNAFDPGLMPGTGLARDYPLVARLAWKGLLPLLRPLMRTFMLGGNVHSAAESGAALAELVVSPEMSGVSGRYFEGRREIASSVESLDERRAQALWASSEALVSESMASDSHATLWIEDHHAGHSSQPVSLHGQRYGAIGSGSVDADEERDSILVQEHLQRLGPHHLVMLEDGVQAGQRHSILWEELVDAQGLRR